MSVTYALAARALTALFNQYLFSFFFVFLRELRGETEIDEVRAARG